GSTVSVSEIANVSNGASLANYTTNLTCSTAFTSGGAPGATSGSFTMPDADVTCTITNTRKTHRVTLTKSLSRTTECRRIDLTAAGVTATGKGDGGFAENGAMAVGTTNVSVSEIAAAGSNLSYYNTNLT